VATYSSVFGSLDISTRPKRRHAVALIVTELIQIRQKENNYVQHMPANLQGSEAAAAAEDSIDLLTDAINILLESYD